MEVSALVYSDSVSRSFTEEVIERSGQNIFACYQCRRCAAGCPVASEIGMSPDRLIRLIIMGDSDGALQNELVWHCVSCYTCGTRCPNQIQTARVVDTLKKMAKERHVRPLSKKVKTFHDAFCAAARHMGRVNEMEFMLRYEMGIIFNELFRLNLKGIVEELKDQTLMGLEMARKGRMHFGVERLKDRSELKRLFKKAQEKQSAHKPSSDARG